MLKKKTSSLFKGDMKQTDLMVVVILKGVA